MESRRPAFDLGQGTCAFQEACGTSSKCGHVVVSLQGRTYCVPMRRTSVRGGQHSDKPSPTASGLSYLGLLPSFQGRLGSDPTPALRALKNASDAAIHGKPYPWGSFHLLHLSKVRNCSQTQLSFLWGRGVYRQVNAARHPGRVPGTGASARAAAHERQKAGRSLQARERVRGAGGRLRPHHDLLGDSPLPRPPSHRCPPPPPQLLPGLSPQASFECWTAQALI